MLRSLAIISELARKGDYLGALELARHLIQFDDALVREFPASFRPTGSRFTGCGMSDEHPAACTSRAALTAELLSGAERSFLAGNLVMAGWLCEEIRRVEPDDPGAPHLLGLIAERERRLTDASTLWRQALASHPHYTPAWLSLATLHRSTGNREAAILCYRCLLAVDPADRDGWYNLGNVLFDGRLAEAAAEAYRRALILDPHHDVSWHNLVWSAMHWDRAGKHWMPCAGRWHTGPTIKPATITSP